jgi:hypothetical protein
VARPKGSRVIAGVYYTPEAVRSMNTSRKGRKRAARINDKGWRVDMSSITVGPPDVSRLDLEIQRISAHLDSLQLARSLVLGDNN